MFRRLICVALSSLLIATTVSRGASASVATYNTEEQWLVNSITTDIAQMVWFAARKNGAQNASETPPECTLAKMSAQPPSYKGSPSPDVSTIVELDDYLWKPDNYIRFANKLLKSKSLVGATKYDTNGDALVEALSNYDSDIIARENKRVSEGLTANPLDASLHEQAALLCTVFAMRECAEYFGDIRSWLNRISAHLGMSRALRAGGDYEVCGQLSEVGLTALCGRQSTSLELNSAMASKFPQSKAIQSMLRGLKIRCTHDFRMRGDEGTTAFENLEYGRALAFDFNTDTLIERIQPKKENAIDWVRIANSGMMSVAAGHQFAEPFPQYELQDFDKDSTLYHQNTKATTDLNLLPTGAIVKTTDFVMAPISWQDVAAFHLRHILESIYDRYIFENEKWGVHDRARQAVEEAYSQLREINKLPFLKSYIVTDDYMASGEHVRTDADLTLKVGKYIDEHPEDTPPRFWWLICKHSTTPAVVPTLTKWFSPTMPYGTAFEPRNRGFAVDGMTLDQLEGWRKLAPYEGYILGKIIEKKFGEKTATAEQMTLTFGPLADFDLRAMDDIAKANMKYTDKYLESLKKLAEFQPNVWFTVAATLLIQNKQAEAATMYQKALKSCKDAVYRSNHVRWLSNYYFDHGDKDKALNIANEAANVGSAMGFDTLAYLQERMGNLSDAITTFQQANERYESPGTECAVNAFYFRHQAENPNYKTAAEAYVKKHFPNGLQKIENLVHEASTKYMDSKSVVPNAQNKNALPKSAPNSAMQNKPPQQGVEIRTSHFEVLGNGLKEGDIVVGFDGFRVENTDQAGFVRRLNLTPTYKLTVWDGTKYKNVSVTLPLYRWRDEVIENYVAKK